MVSPKLAWTTISLLALMALGSLCGKSLVAQTLNDPAMTAWETFAKTKFKSRYYEEIDMYLLAPEFPAELKKLEGTKVQLRGYFIPFDTEDGESIIISRYPYSQCFFCGGAGPESVAEVFFRSNLKRFRPDEMITVHGTLRLNESDIDHVNFIIENAEVIIGTNK